MVVHQRCRKFNIPTRSWDPKIQLIIIESFKFRFIVLWLKFEFTALDKGFPYWPIKFKLIYGWSRIDQSDSSSTIRHFRSENAKRTFGQCWQLMHMTWIRRHQQHPSPVMWSLSVQISVFVKDVRSRKKIEYCRIHGFQRLHPRYSKIRCTFADFKRWFNFFRSSNVPLFKITRLVNFRQPISAWLKWESDFPTASHIKTTTRIIKVRLIRTVWDHPGRLRLIMFVWLDLLQGGFLAH